MDLTSVFWKNARSKNRITINSGGTSSSKTYSILQKIILRAVKNPGTITSIVSETMPHLKRGAMRDFFNILLSENIYRKDYHNKTDSTYRFGTSIVEFFSADNDAKVRGARRDYLYINECNNVPYRVFDQLEVRTRKAIDLDFNPVAEFWVHENVIPHREHLLIHSTYKDNEMLDSEIIKAIESRQHSDPAWWRVYGLGELGRVEGVVFPNWTQVDHFPDTVSPVLYGLDFGYSNDPTAMIKIGTMGNNLYMDEIIYQSGLITTDLCRLMEQKHVAKSDLIVADSANPESIAQIQRYGFSVLPAHKPKGSINSGIDQMKQKNMYVTKRSVNLIKELRNYKWKEDKHGTAINVPIDAFNHAIDAVRYSHSHTMEGKGNVLSWKIL